MGDNGKRGYEPQPDVGQEGRGKNDAVREIVERIADQNHGSSRLEMGATDRFRAMAVMPKRELLQKKERKYSRECSGQDCGEWQRLGGFGKQIQQGGSQQHADGEADEIGNPLAREGQCNYRRDEHA